jgi:histidinol dehydrogenase
MRCERFGLPDDGDPVALAASIRALVPASASVQEAVAAIVARVRSEGDAAVREYTRRLDTQGAEPAELIVDAGELEAALAGLDDAVRRGLEAAIDNVWAVAAASSDAGAQTRIPFETHSIVVGSAPVARAAVYVPGGRASYPSTVVMGVVPARVAGVGEIAVCSPPGADAELDRVTLAACQLAGASAVYRMGGAQAIAALAFGTESVAPVDVIVGPGNLYVQEAKRQVFGEVGIDGFAGPSDMVLVADAGVDSDPLALDLLAQAEHGPGTLVVAISESSELLDVLGGRLREAPDSGAVACLVDTSQPFGLVQAFAPEHLQLVGARSQALAPKVTRAGCVFVGAGAGTAFGDYIAGSNHILPTGGAARFASGLTPGHFLRRLTQVHIDDGSELARLAAPVARAEGFELHARSMEARIRDNG